MLVTANVFQPLIDVFETVLKFFHNTGGIPWGWSIVLLTIAVRAVLIPLTFRQIKSMVRMQGFAPQMKEIQKKYKDDKQRQQEEMMKFYRENNVNPLGSCLPLVLQLPVFISLYYMLKTSLRRDICPQIQHVYQHAYALKHHITLAAASGNTTACGHSSASHFLFVHDLTAKATGIELGALIVLYVGSQLGSSLLMSAASMDKNQRRIMLFMPLIFVLFVIRFPAGVLVYWITTNLWTIVQQYVVKRRIGPVQAANAAAAAEVGAGNGRGGGGLSRTSGDAGNGGGRGTGSGGLGGRLFDRLRAAQEDAARRSKPSSEEPVGGVGASGSATKTRAAKASAGDSGNGTASGKSSSSSSTAKTPGGNGNGNGGSVRSGTPPPRPPRKKKKRSGRRR